MFLIDTNVMMAASAVSELSKLGVRAMPQEIELRERVYKWLVDFEQSDQCVVLDEEDLVRDEYDRNMPHNFQEQEYGMQVLQSKQDKNLARYVPINISEENGERIGVIEQHHEQFVPDRADRKWVACAFSAKTLYDQMPPIVYGAEMDWFIGEERLQGIGISLKRLLPDEWYKSRLVCVA